MTPRQALANLIKFLLVDMQQCATCVNMPDALDTCHEKKFAKLLREAQAALKTSLN